MDLEYIRSLMQGGAVTGAFDEILAGDSDLAQQTRAERDYVLPSPGSAEYNSRSPEERAAIDRERARREEVARRQRQAYIDSVGGYGNYEGGFNDQDYWNSGAVSTDGAYWYGGEIYDGTTDPMNGTHYGAGYNGGSGYGGSQGGGMFATGSGGTSEGTGYVAPTDGNTSGGGHGTGHGGSNGCPPYHRWDEDTQQCVNVYDNPSDGGTSGQPNDQVTSSTPFLDAYLRAREQANRPGPVSETFNE